MVKNMVVCFLAVVVPIPSTQPVATCAKTVKVIIVVASLKIAELHANNNINNKISNNNNKDLVHRRDLIAKSAFSSSNKASNSNSNNNNGGIKRKMQEAEDAPFAVAIKLAGSTKVANLLPHRTVHSWDFFIWQFLLLLLRYNQADDKTIDEGDKSSSHSKSKYGTLKYMLIKYEANRKTSII